MLCSRHGVPTYRTSRSLLALGNSRQATSPKAPRVGSQLRSMRCFKANSSPDFDQGQAKEAGSGTLPVLIRLSGWFGRGQRVGVLGSIPELGSWDPNDVRVLLHTPPEEIEDPYDDEPRWFWFGRLPAGADIEFKFLTVDVKNGNAFKRWIDDLVGDQSLKLKVEEGNTLEVGDLYIEVQPDIRIGFEDVGEPDLDAVVEITEEERLEQARLREKVKATMAENEALLEAAWERVKHVVPQAAQYASLQEAAQDMEARKP